MVAFCCTDCLRKPLRYSDLHFATQQGTNRGKSVPVHVIPVDDQLFYQIVGIRPEDWFVHELAETTPGIQKQVFQGKGKNIIRVERLNHKNDFLVVTDFADIDAVDLQRLKIGEKYWRTKKIYILISEGSIRLITKDVYESLIY